MKQNIIIIGAGGHGWSVAETLLMMDKFNLVGFVDDKYPTTRALKEIPILASTHDNFENLLELATQAIVAIGKNKIRENLCRKLISYNFTLATVIHPTSIISPSAHIGPGSTIMAGSIIGSNTVIGTGVIVNSGAVIDHDCTLEDFSHMGVGSSIGGGSRLCTNAWLLPGKSLDYNKTLLESTSS